MEVHAHTHPSASSGHRKKWTHYFWEFLMLFLAVFCGFLAENQREHMIEHKREKQYMQSLVSDLALDTAYLNLIYKIKLTKAFSIDSTLNYFKIHPESCELTPEVWRTISTTGYDRVFIHHNGTIDQLKNSGGMRLIRKRNIVDSLEGYYQQVTRAEIQRAQWLQYVDDMRKINAKVWNAFDRIDREKLDSNTLDRWTNIRVVSIDDPIKIRINREYLNEYLNFLMMQRAFLIASDMVTNRMLFDKAIWLISFIKKEYRMK